MRITLAAAALATTLTAPAMAFGVQGFEDVPTGATFVYVEDPDTGFGFFTGGTVSVPGDTVDATFALAGNKVLYGTEILFSTLYPGDYHCCGYGRHEMLISAPQGVLIELYGHGPDWQEEWNEVLLHAEVLTGLNLFFGWGVPLELQGWDGAGDITSIRWTGVDGASLAIDNFTGVGFAAIPEPASWAMMIAGFGLVGTAVRRRKVALA